MALGGPQQQAVLAVLLLTPGHAVGMSDLVDALWPDDPPPQARTTVRTYMSRLRRSMAGGVDGDGRPTLERLSSVPGGYHLAVSALHVDALHAERLAADAGGVAATGDLERARGLLGEALALWQGEPLIGVPGPFAARHRDRLEDLRLALVEERVALDIALGHAALSVPELISFVREHPLRERLYDLLMRALCQAGRHVEALAVFRDARRLLVRELGVEPGPGLVALHRRILNGDPELATRVPALPAAGGTRTPPLTAAATNGSGPDSASALRSTRAWPGDEARPAAEPGGTPVSMGRGRRMADARRRPAQLPPDDPDFTGREAAVHTLGAALTATAPGRDALRIAAVAGMGGVGKTALAVHVAHRVKSCFPDGQLYAELRCEGEPLSPDAVLTAFLSALGATAETLPDGLAAKSALFRSLTDGRRLLVVLDDAVDSRQVRPLLPGAPGCAVLVTSRARLAVLPGARHVGLGVFSHAEARDLLERLIGVERVVGEPDAVAELARVCGFLPLAVRIVSARLAARPGWTIQAMNDRLSDERRRIDELRFGDLAVRSTFERGYRRLTPGQARAFRLAATLDQELSLSRASALLAVEERAADDLLESLVDVAMLESPSAGRYRPHDLLRAFGRRQSEDE
jgi:pentatricopeptide repeat protein